MKKTVLLTILIIFYIHDSNAQINKSFYELKVKGDSLMSVNVYVKAYQIFDNPNYTDVYEQQNLSYYKQLISYRIDSIIHTLKTQEKPDKRKLKRFLKTQKDIESIAFHNAVNSEKDSKRLYENLDTLNLSDKHLRHLPLETEKCFNLKSINLIGNPDLDWEQTFGILDKLEHLNEIIISIHTIDSIQQSYLNKITGLQLLDINLNKIPGKILNLKQLTYLDLNGKRIFPYDTLLLQEELFELIELRYLRISSYSIQTLPPEIENLKHLKYLYLDQNHFTSLPPEIGNLKNLTVLDLYKNKLTELPPEIGNLTNLKELNLGSEYTDRDCDERDKDIPFYSLMNESISFHTGRNQIKVFPPEFFKLTGLEILNISGNYISKLQEGFGNFKNLKELYLSDNKLVSLPEEIFLLKKLTTLDLYRNFIYNFSAQIGELTSLTHLDIKYNRLSELPVEFGKLKKLKTLYSDCNYFKSIPDEILNLVSLTELTLSNNKISDVPSELTNLTNLRHLDLSYNKLYQSEKDKLIKLLPNCYTNSYQEKN